VRGGHRGRSHGWQAWLEGLAGSAGPLGVGARWYAVALGLSTALALTAAGLHLLLDARASVNLSELSGLNFVVFALIVVEKLGWRPA
jgi:hypothetical protein